MAGEIFISYRRADEAWAQLLHAQLRAEGVEAWYDAQVGAGQDWRAATAKALQASHIFVLLFSRAASESEDIAKELAAAIFSKKLVVPVRIENIQPAGAFLYELASRNWVNAFENTEPKLAELAQSLAKLVKAGVVDESIIPFDRNAGVKVTAQKRSWLARKPLVIAAAALVMAAAAAGLFWIRPAAVDANSQPPPRPAGVSVAVLPFLSLSSDKEQEFFSDGITEEITSALAKVPGLKVIGRTSVLQFKDKNKGVLAIGQALHSAYLIEGSVRKDGNQVRITAQLIEADNGLQLWTESYDRELKGIFAIQEEIATAIASALRVPLGLAQGERLVSNRTDNLEAYQQYLHARALYRARKSSDAIAALEPVVARDPNFAPAWAMLANAYTLPAGTSALANAIRARSLEEARHLEQIQFGRAEEAARKAIRLDSRQALAYDALGWLQFHDGKFAASEDYYRLALTFDPNDPDILYDNGTLLALTGHLKQAQRLMERILAQEPFVPSYRVRAANLLSVMGQTDAAIRILEPLVPGTGRNLVLANAYASAGRYVEAADTLLAIPATSFMNRRNVEDAARLIRSAPAKNSAPETLPALGGLGFVYLFIGAEGRYLTPPEPGFSLGFDIWGSPSASLRKTEQFKAFARKAGLVDYWRARGWPDLCYPEGGDDFACK